MRIFKFLFVLLSGCIIHIGVFIELIAMYYTYDNAGLVENSF